MADYCPFPMPLPLTNSPVVDDGRDAFDRAMAILRADVTALAGMVANDAQVRLAYAAQIDTVSRQFVAEVQAGRLTWAQAADEASALRNDVMDLMRGRSSPVGRALAESMKAGGLTRETLLAKYSQDLFGKDFLSLTARQQDEVYAALVSAAGRSNPQVNARMARWSRIGRGLIVISIGVAVYTIATSDDPVAQAVEEAAIMGGGIAGGVAGGAAAGLLCGPGAPICVGIGAVVGGIAGAFGVSLFF